MARKSVGTPNAANLRRRAQERMREQPAGLQAVNPTEAERLLQELQVHQVELEMQNEELRRAQQEIEALHARYFDLYNLAPVGYCTVSESGLILEAESHGCPIARRGQTPVGQAAVYLLHSSRTTRTRTTFTADSSSTRARCGGAS